MDRRSATHLRHRSAASLPGADLSDDGWRGHLGPHGRHRRGLVRCGVPAPPSNRCLLRQVRMAAWRRRNRSVLPTVSGPRRSDGSSNVHVNLSRPLAAALTGALLSLCAAVTAAAQVVPCDFDVADDLGHQFWGSAAHVAGRAGGSSELADFLLINADKAEMDVDHDGYTQTGCGYNNIFIPSALRTNLVNIANAAIAIPAANVVVTNLPQSLPAGTTARVGVYVEIPVGTPAGRYTGNFQIRDAVRGVALGPNNEVLGVDIVYIDLTVLPDLSFSIISSDSAAPLDSLLIRARAGATGSSVFRVANTSNAPLTDIQLSASD